MFRNVEKIILSYAIWNKVSVETQSVQFSNPPSMMCARNRGVCYQTIPTTRSISRWLYLGYKVVLCGMNSSFSRVAIRRGISILGFIVYLGMIIVATISRSKAIRALTRLSESSSRLSIFSRRSTLCLRAAKMRRYVFS